MPPKYHAQRQLAYAFQKAGHDIPPEATRTADDTKFEWIGTCPRCKATGTWEVVSIRPHREEIHLPTTPCTV